MDLKKNPPHFKRILPKVFFMTSYLDSHKTTDINPEMLSGVQTGNGTPHDKYDIRPCAHKQKRRHFHAKTAVYWRSTHGAEHIPHCGSNTTFVVLVFSISYIFVAFLHIFLNLFLLSPHFLHLFFSNPFYVFLLSHL